MKAAARRLILLACALPGCFSAMAADGFRDQVVALSVTHQGYYEHRPWDKAVPQTREAFGTVVQGRRILVAAQMVENSTLIRVEKHGRPPRVPARVVHVDPMINLAVLTVDAPGFFDDLAPVRLAPHTIAKGTATSVRWRRGQLETLTGRFTRLGVEESRAGLMRHLMLFLTSDISDGGWSEPVFQKGRLVGITFYQDDRMSQIIPVDLIAAYLDATMSPDSYQGFPVFGAGWQTNRDRVQAVSLGLSGPPRGVVIRKTIPGTSVDSILQPRDILLELDGNRIDAEGYYRHKRYGRLPFDHIVTDGHHTGDIIQARILRDGSEQLLQIPLRSFSSELALVPLIREAAPPYLIAGGLVFRELDGEYLRAWGKGWRQKAPLRLRIYQGMSAYNQTRERRRLVMLSAVLPDNYNTGYHGLAYLVLDTVNGRSVDSVADVRDALAAPEGGFHVFRFVRNHYRNEIVLDAAEFSEATARILANYNIPAPARFRPRPLTQLHPLGTNSDG